MSKQSEAKKEQDYSTGRTCSTCASLQSEKTTTRYGYVKENKLRCAIGGFAVKKLATCRFYKSAD